jgi:hypothetical protein
LDNLTQNPPGKKVVRRPTIHHVGLLFVELLSQNLSIGDLLRLAGGWEKALRD